MAVYTTLAEAKAQCNVDYTDDDVLIARLQNLVEECVFDDIVGTVKGVGTVTTNGTTALVGADTTFLDYLVGWRIRVYGERWRTIATIPTETGLTVSSAFTTSASGLTYEIEKGFPLVNGALPEKLKHAMLVQLANFYANRESVLIGVSSMKQHYSYQYLIDIFKNWTVA
jgi:hypothetical protein